MPRSVRTPALAILALTAPAWSQGSGLPARLQERVNEAVARGADALLVRQELDGSWRPFQDSHPSGQTALCLYALLRGGLGAQHQAVQRAAAYLRCHPADTTYAGACQLLALGALADASDEERIEALVELLLSWQDPGGGFAYPARRVDLSNSQFAALGLRAAAGAGVAVPKKVWKRLAEFARRHQEAFADDEEPAGFSYRQASDATGSMTTAGLTILAIGAERGVRGRALEGARQRGLEWLAQHFAVDANPRPGLGPLRARERRDTNLFYYLYGLERVAALLDLELVGEHDWYREGASFLVDRQGEEGLWLNQTSTCFALLFLRKATHPAVSGSSARGVRRYGRDDPEAPVSLRASGDAPLTLWISSFGRSALEELEWEGERDRGPRVVRVVYVREEASGEPTILATAHGDPDAPADGDRYAIQHSFARPGPATIIALVTCLRPGASSDGTEGLVELRSAPLAVSVLQAWNEELLDYASDAGRNVLLAAEVEVTASSEASPAFGARRVLDARLASGWRSADGDPRPTIRLELTRLVRADTLLLTHTYNPSGRRTARIRRVALRVNDAGRPIELALVPDDWRKTVVSLGKMTRVRTLELQVLESSPGRAGEEGVGLAEVELQLRGRRR